MVVRKKSTIEATIGDLPIGMPVAKETSHTAMLENLKLQSAGQINSLFDRLINEVNALEELKKRTKEELERQKRAQQQREEQENLTLSLAQRRKQAEFDEKLDKEKRASTEDQNQKEEKLRLQKEILDKKEQELQDFKTQIESFPQKLAKAVEETKKQISAELKKDFDSEKKLLLQGYEADGKLLNQQVTYLLNQSKQLDKEIQSLKEEKRLAIEQVKDLAVAVVRGKEKDLVTATVQ
ncbi:MAG: hypothetical protein AAB415_01750 [Patescibacteria group bacterium]